MLALILAGGEGSRLKLGEKGLVPVGGKPMISLVLDAFTDGDCSPVVVTSYKTPFTRNWCRANGVDFIDTAGAGYVEDLHEAVAMTEEDGALFTSAADIPCLSSKIIREVREKYTASGKPACSTWIPIKYCERFGVSPRYRQIINGVEAAPCAFNIFMGSLLDEVQDELSILLDEPGLAFNINTREELAVLEREWEKHRLLKK
ncbi:MAG: NTP transferase domain-containing protein [Methanocorpusculum sp.]|nr:NTP transferase domain-containing protein [Methanocorpusculum sp.]